MAHALFALQGHSETAPVVLFTGDVLVFVEPANGLGGVGRVNLVQEHSSLAASSVMMILALSLPGSVYKARYSAGAVMRRVPLGTVGIVVLMSIDGAGHGDCSQLPKARNVISSTRWLPLERPSLTCDLLRFEMAWKQYGDIAFALVALPERGDFLELLFRGDNHHVTFDPRLMHPNAAVDDVSLG